jgi:acyl carrier protein
MDISDKVRAFIQKNFYTASTARLDDETSLLDAGIVDSTGVLEVVTYLESEFGIKVDDSELLPENLDSIANITAFVQRKKG